MATKNASLTLLLLHWWCLTSVSLKLSGQSSEEHLLFCVYSQGSLGCSPQVRGVWVWGSRWAYWCFLFFLLNCYVGSAAPDAPCDAATDTSINLQDPLQIGSKNQVLKAVETFSTLMYKIGKRGPKMGRVFLATEAEPTDTNLLFKRQKQETRVELISKTHKLQMGRVCDGRDGEG